MTTFAGDIDVTPVQSDKKKKKKEKRMNFSHFLKKYRPKE